MEAEYIIDPPSLFEPISVHEAFVAEMKELLIGSPNNDRIRGVIAQTQRTIEKLKQ